MKNEISFGESLKEILNTKSKAIKDFANDVDISLSTAYSWLNNTTEPSLSKLIKMADYFKCSVEFLIGRADNEGYIKVENYPPIAEQIKKVLKDANISTYKLMQISKFDGAYFYNWSHGSEPYLSTLKELAKIADCTIDHLIGRTN